MQTSTQAVRARTDEPFLERFIEAHEAFVLRCASRHAGFAVTRSDDEYSVALLAFYEAIKGYDPASGPFGAYASLVIGRRLADHYRSQHRRIYHALYRLHGLYGCTTWLGACALCLVYSRLFGAKKENGGGTVIYSDCVRLVG